MGKWEEIILDALVEMEVEKFRNVLRYRIPHLLTSSEKIEVNFKIEISDEVRDLLRRIIKKLEEEG